MSVRYSILDAGQLAEAVSRAFFAERPVACELRSRSWTDVYRVFAGRALYAARLWRTGFHDRAEIEFQCRVLKQLRAAGLAVPVALAAQGGGHTLRLEAPEGARFLAVFDWLDGTPIGAELTPEDARRAGLLLARLHQAGADVSPEGSPPATGARVDCARLERLERVLAYRGIEGAPILQGIRGVAGRVAQLDESGLPRGLIHGDFHHFNVLRLAGDELALIDFDDVCVGARVRDLASFQWALQHLRQPAALFDALLAGYETCRVLEPAERAACATFVAERDCWSLLAWADNINLIGDPGGRFEAVLHRAGERFAALLAN